MNDRQQKNADTVLGILDRAVGEKGIKTDFGLVVTLKIPPDAYWKSALTIVLVGVILKALSLLLDNTFKPS